MKLSQNLTVGIKKTKAPEDEALTFEQAEEKKMEKLLIDIGQFENEN